MRVCLFEDRGVELLEPLTLTRPAFDLWCGASALLVRQARCFAADEIGALVRPGLAALSRLSHPQIAVNDCAWLRAATTILVNARWLPPAEPPADLQTPHVGLVGDQVAYAVLSPELLTYCSLNTIDDCTETWKQRLPQRAAGGWMIDYPWDLVQNNAEMLRQDHAYHAQHEDRIYRPFSLSVVGPSHLLWADPTAQIDPHVVANTTRGPVLIEQGAVVHAFSRLEGPCYIGPHSWVLGAKVRCSSIGPGCRVGGEVEASTLHGHVNKYHDGFLGHAYVGEWVNLAAGTQVSDLRHDYQTVTLAIHGRHVDSGLTKIGAIIGDHTKLGLNTLLNTGSVVGAFCNLLPTGMYLPRSIPSFCTYWNGRLLEQPNLEQVFATAGTVMARRNCELTPHHAALYRSLFDHTSGERRQAIREREQRTLRRSA